MGLTEASWDLPLVNGSERRASTQVDSWWVRRWRRAARCPPGGEGQPPAPGLPVTVGLTGVSSAQTRLGQRREPARRACGPWTGMRPAASASGPCVRAACAPAAAAEPWPAPCAPSWSECRPWGGASPSWSGGGASSSSCLPQLPGSKLSVSCPCGQGRAHRCGLAGPGGVGRTRANKQQ